MNMRGYWFLAGILGALGLAIGMRQKISPKIAMVPRYGSALRQSGVVVARAAEALSLGAALEPGLVPALMRRSS